MIYLYIVSIHSLILHLDFLFCFGHLISGLIKGQRRMMVQLLMHKSVCVPSIVSKSDLHVFSIRKIVCFILIVPYSDLHVVSIHTGWAGHFTLFYDLPAGTIWKLRDESALNTQENRALEQICTRVQILKHPSHGQKYTRGANLRTWTRL